jgi:hypothetical protein
VWSGEATVLPVPIKIRFTRRCQRCGLRYPKADAACPHCTGLTEREVQELKDRHEDERAGNANLGRLLLYIAGLLLVAMLFVALSGA